MSLKAEVYDMYVREIEAHREENRRAAGEMMADIERSPLYFKEQQRVLDNPLAIQKVYSEEDVAVFREVSRVMHRISEKAILKYIEDPAFRALFGFPKELEELILADAGYDEVLPMARFDIFYHEDTGAFKFCEINTDGTSAMNEDYQLDMINIKNPAHQAVLRKFKLEPFETLDSWVETFLRIYGEYRENRVRQGRDVPEVPNVAIVDFLDKAIVAEFYEFARRFQKAGVNAEVVDIRELRYEDGVLYSPAGYRVDAIYRRAVTADVMKGYDEVQPLVQAVMEGNIFLCGAFRSQIAHTKTYFKVLHLPEMRAILTDEENRFVEEHIPYTLDFSEEGLRSVGLTLADVLSDKDRWILKPNDSYGSDSVADGKGRSAEEWEAFARKVYERGFICQEYAPQYKTVNVDFANGDGEFAEYINMSGLYTYDGVFKGLFTRQSAGTIIASHASERNVASYVVTGRK